MSDFNYEKYKEYNKRIKRFNPTDKNVIKTMNYFYKTVKSLSNDLYVPSDESSIKVGYFDSFYDSKILKSLVKTEDCLKDQYIMEPNSTPIEGIRLSEIDHDTTSDIILNSIVLEANIRLYKKFGLFHSYKKDVGKLDLTDECEKVALIVKDICNSLKIRNIVYKIEHGFEKNSRVKSGYHYFNILIIGDRRFLIDLTYQQFFKLSNNIIERLGVPHLLGCAPGVYMKLSAERCYTAEVLLNNGWIEATNDVLKNYFDGFALSFRNGLYYENSLNDDFNTPYSLDDYFKFLSGKDSQVNHEGRENLGIQLRPMNTMKK